MESTVETLQGIKHIIRGVAAWAGNRITVNYVDPDAVDHGIGRQMITYIERAVAEAGHKHVVLFSSEAGRHFYRRLGYVEDGLPERGNGVSWNFPMRKAL